jgi:hypothetical protein
MVSITITNKGNIGLLYINKRKMWIFGRIKEKSAFTLWK